MYFSISFSVVIGMFFIVSLFLLSTFLKCPQISTEVLSLIKHFMWSSLLEIVSGLGISSSINAGKA